VGTPAGENDLLHEERRQDAFVAAKNVTRLKPVLEVMVRAVACGLGGQRGGA